MGDDKLGTDTILTELSIPSAPVRRKGIENAVRFLKGCGLPWQKIYSYIQAMDLSKPVGMRTLKQDTVLIGYRNRAHPYGQFYTVAGTSSRNAGIQPRGTTFIRYRVHKAVSALESRAASFKHIQRGFGGALQFILSAQQAKQCLQIFTISDQDQE